MRCERCEGTGQIGPKEHRYRCPLCGGEGDLPENGNLYCYGCNGTGRSMAFVDGRDTKTGRHWGELRQVTCLTCKGEGALTPERLRAINEGAAMRRERIARGESIRDAAARLGVDVVTLSQREHGEVAT